VTWSIWREAPSSAFIPMQKNQQLQPKECSGLAIVTGLKSIRG